MKFPTVLTSWKTTASGIIFALAVFAQASGLDMPAWMNKSLRGLEAVGVICLGMSAKDFNVSGQPPKAE